MSNSLRSARYWVRAWWPVVLMACLIALESTTWFGSDHTGAPLRIVWQALFGHVTDARWEVIHHYIRKTGHFTGYGLTGLAWLRAWRMTLPGASFLRCAPQALIGTAAIATADEVHQMFLPNRTGTFWDVLLDCCGAAIMLLAALAFVRMRNPKALAEAA